MGLGTWCHFVLGRPCCPGCLARAARAASMHTAPGESQRPHLAPGVADACGGGAVRGAGPLTGTVWVTVCASRHKAATGARCSPPVVQARGPPAKGRAWLPFSASCTHCARETATPLPSPLPASPPPHHPGVHVPHSRDTGPVGISTQKASATGEGGQAGGNEGFSLDLSPPSGPVPESLHIRMGVALVHQASCFGNQPVCHSWLPSWSCQASALASMPASAWSEASRPMYAFSV